MTAGTRKPIESYTASSATSRFPMYGTNAKMILSGLHGSQELCSSPLSPGSLRSTGCSNSVRILTTWTQATCPSFHQRHLGVACVITTPGSPSHRNIEIYLGLDSNASFTESETSSGHFTFGQSTSSSCPYKKDRRILRSGLPLPSGHLITPVMQYVPITSTDFDQSNSTTNIFGSSTSTNASLGTSTSTINTSGSSTTTNASLGASIFSTRTLGTSTASAGRLHNFVNAVCASHKRRELFNEVQQEVNDEPLYSFNTLELRQDGGVRWNTVARQGGP
jgi:hypothetical protein